MTSLGWGIVGLGGVAETEIAPAISALDNCRLVGVAGRDQARADDFAARHGADWAGDDYGALLTNPDVAAVYIATPNALHSDQVIAAARAGKHVLCDKPLATSVPEAQAAIEHCAAAGVALGLTFQSRYFGGMAEIRAALAAGRIGPVRVVQLEMGAGRKPLAGWRTDPRLAGLGTINNIGVHGYDLLRYLLGSEVVQVAAMLGYEATAPTLETTSLGLLRFADGALAYVNANQSVPGSQADLVIYGERGRIIARNATRPGRSGPVSIESDDGEPTKFDVDTSVGYRALIGAFVSAVSVGQDPEPSGLDGLRCLQIADALAESWRARRLIDLCS